MYAQGAGPQRSGFLSAFFTLVGTHGLHVSMGLIWIPILTIQLLAKGLTEPVVSRLFRLGLFWHFLDIVWVGIFSIVYLPGTSLMQTPDPAESLAADLHQGLRARPGADRDPVRAGGGGPPAAFTTLVVIAILALVQVVVHLRYFLHIDLKSTPRDNLLALAFAAVLICIMVGGTLWIMLDLNARMMG